MLRGSYWNCFYDSGAPLNYQIVSFLLPAEFAKLSGISGHLSFWAFSMPFYKMMCVLIFGFSIRRLLYVRNITPAFVLTTLGLLLFTFSSLNVINLLRLKWSSLVFFAAGNYWPGGNPGMTLGFALMVAAMFLVIRAYTMKNLLIAGFCIIVIMVTKIAMWYPIIAFVGFYAMLRGFGKANLIKLGMLLLISVTSCALYVIFYTKFSAAKFVVQPFVELRDTILRTFKIDNISAVKNLLFFLGYLILSFGIRIIIISFPFFKRYKSDKDLRNISIATCVAVILCSLLMLPFKIYYYDLKGNIVYDSSYNLEQFLRSCFIIVMFSSVFLLFVFFNKLSPLFRKVSFAIVFIYCSLIAYGNYTFYSKAAATYKVQPNPWRENVRNYFAQQQSSEVLLCMVGNSLEYKAQDLVADGIGPWWYSGKTNDGSFAYFFTTQNNASRIPLMDSLLSGVDKIEVIRQLKKQDVTHLIVAPNETPHIDSLAKAGYLKLTTSRFVYQIIK
jgi:hypothetical protein